jgi:hypothetical protein
LLTFKICTVQYIQNVTVEQEPPELEPHLDTAPAVYYNSPCSAASGFDLSFGSAMLIENIIITCSIILLYALFAAKVFLSSKETWNLFVYFWRIPRIERTRKEKENLALELELGKKSISSFKGQYHEKGL